MRDSWSVSNRRVLPPQLLTAQHPWKVKEKTSPYTSPYACFSQQLSCYVAWPGGRFGLFRSIWADPIHMYEAMPQVLDLDCRLGGSFRGPGCSHVDVNMPLSKSLGTNE